jgi:cytochrome P450
VPVERGAPQGTAREFARALQNGDQGRRRAVGALFAERDGTLERKFSPFEYIPFGGMGAAFAMYELKVVLGTLLHGYRLRPGSLGTPQNVRRGLTLGPRGGIPMVFVERRVG